MAFARHQQTVVDAQGNAVPGATITVREQIGNALAMLYSDRDGAVPLANPFTADASGLFKFHASGGIYKVTAVSGLFSVTWEFVPLGTLGETDLEDIQDYVNNAIDTAGVGLAAIADDTILSNTSGGSAVPVGNTLSALLDGILGNTHGALITRGASVWSLLAPGTSGHFLKSQGTGADLVYAALPAPPPWTYIFKGSDQTRTSSAALVDDADLQIAVTNGQTLVFRVVYFIRPNGSVQTAINGPAASSIRVSASSLGSSGGSMVTSYNSPFASSTAIATPQILEAFGKVVFTASGTFSLRIAQATSNATASAWEAGSYLEYKLI